MMAHVPTTRQGTTPCQVSLCFLGDNVDYKLVQSYMLSGRYLLQESMLYLGMTPSQHDSTCNNKQQSVYNLNRITA